MEFRTVVPLPAGETVVSPSHRLLLMGSCFSDHIGRLLQAHKFRVECNPWGTLYNPLSLLASLEEAASGKVYTVSDLYAWQGRWHSPMHHGSFSAEQPEEAVRHINRRLADVRALLPCLDYAFFTLGSAYYYKEKHSGRVVGNCHKRPERDFERCRMESPEAVREVLVRLVGLLRRFNPQVKVVFSVSPIRHVRDGFHANQVSKGLLLAALADDDDDPRLVDHRSVFYFPAYEIVMDELRDYRFYADDLVHPSTQAVAYLWECFARTYFDADTRAFVADWEAVAKGLGHRPSRPGSDEHRAFVRQILLKIEHLTAKYPFLDAENELTLCHTLLKS